MLLTVTQKNGPTLFCPPLGSGREALRDCVKAAAAKVEVPE